MNFFVTGVGGQLGHDVMNELLKRGHEGVGSDIQETYSGVADGSAVTKAPYVALDITDKEAVEKVITEVNPDAVIHCAAWTAVDMAEDDDKVAKVRAINAGGTQNIADVCKKLDCKMTYISTDYVFDGQGTEPWQPDCKDYKPLNVYGQTKLEGELAVSQTLEKYFMDETKVDGVTRINDHEFEFHNAHCFKIDIPQIGPAQAIYYDVAALKACCKYIKEHRIKHPIVYIMACRIGPFAGHFYKEIHKLGGTVYLNPDGECEIIWATREKPDFMRVYAA